MNSGVLDLKTRRKISFAPADAGAERIASLAAGAGKAPAPTTAADAPAGGIVQVSRTARGTEAFIVSIGCVKQAFAVRFPQGALAMARRGASRAILRLGGRSAGVSAPPANGRAPRPTRPRHRRAPASRSWGATREPTTGPPPS